MRLLNIHTLEIEEFWDENVKKYAILSHRWEDEEVSFQDMQNLAVASSKKGYAKIQKSCEQAAKDGHSYLWVDTFCINKESSAELTEALNSMFRWYQASAICYAFLSDVLVDTVTSDNEKQIKSSIWLTRGWTLQELLAPKHVVFYDRNWEILGTKQTMSRVLSLQTGINTDVLGGAPIGTRSIAQRMSWASRRVTTRVEDMAYCLMGIFDVNMPLLYGEGEKAFIRLQEEIIKHSDDHTIFAWRINRDHQHGLLADSPAAFQDCHNIRTLTSRKGRHPYSVTNRGLSLSLVVIPWTTDTYFACLDCADERLSGGLLQGQPFDKFRIGIFLRRLSEDDQYARVTHEGKTCIQSPASTWEEFEEAMDEAGREEENWQLRQSGDLNRSWQRVRQIKINVRQKLVSNEAYNLADRVNGFRVATTGLLDHSDNSGMHEFEVSAPSWDPQERIMAMNPGDFGAVGYIDIQEPGPEIRVIQLGFDFEYNPVCFMATEHSIHYLMPSLNRQGFTFKSWEALFKENICDWGLGVFSDGMTWCKVHPGVIIEQSLCDWKMPYKGVWAVKGDRLNGLSAKIGHLAVLRFAKTARSGKLVWNLYFDSIKDDTT